MTNQFALPINLQLFAEDTTETTPSVVEAPVQTETPAETSKELPKLGTKEFTAMVDEAVNGQSAEKVYAGKFKTVEDVEKGYVNLEKAFNKRDAEISELRKVAQQVEQFKAEIEQLKARPQEAATTESKPAEQSQQQVIQDAIADMTDEEKEQFSLELFENPVKALQSVLDKVLPNYLNPIQEQVKPIVEERNHAIEYDKVVDNIAQFAQAHEDFEALAPTMQEVFSQNPALANLPNGLDLAYNIAKGMKPTAAPPSAVDVDKLAADPEVQSKVVSNYLQSLKAGGPPPTINGSNGAPSATPEYKPVSIKEAGLLASKLFSS